MGRAKPKRPRRLRRLWAMLPALHARASGSSGRHCAVGEVVQALRFTFTGTRHPRRELQLQEIQLFGASSNMALDLQHASVTNPGGRSPARQHVRRLLDGDMLTSHSKFVDLMMAARGHSIVEIWLPPDMPRAQRCIAAYAFITANDNPGRDPTSWDVSVVRVGEDVAPGKATWTLVHAVRGATPPRERFASFGRTSLLPMAPAAAAPSLASNSKRSNARSASPGDGASSLPWSVRYREIESLTWSMEINGTALAAARSPWTGAGADLLESAALSCAHSDVIGWPRAACVASTVGASTLPCPALVKQIFSSRYMKLGFAAATVAAMGCRADGVYEFSTFSKLTAGADESDGGGRYRFVAEFNRTRAFNADAHTCKSFRWAHAKGRRPIHGGAAILGADKDIARALPRLKTVSLLHLGMRPESRARDGLWSPCTNLAFVMCAVRGWLPQQGGPNFFLASRFDAIGRRCRPCAACKDGAPQFFDECYIVKSEYCLLTRACKNGRELSVPGNLTGFWRCDPDWEALRSVAAGRARPRCRM